MRSKHIRKIFWGCAALILDIFLCYKTIGSYWEYQKTLEGLNTPLEMAEVFMTSEYDSRWGSIPKVLDGTRYDVIEYKIWADIISDMYTHYYMYDDREFSDSIYRDGGREWVGHTYKKGTDFIIYGDTQNYISSSETGTEIYLSFSLNGSSNIWGTVVCYGENEEVEGYGVDLIEENGAYVVKGGKLEEDGTYVLNDEDIEEDLKENTGMTVEEIVEIVEKNKQGFDDIMYEMKTHEIKRNRLFCIGKLVVLHVLLIAFLIYLNWDIVKSKIKGLRKEREQDGKSSIKE